MQLEKILEEIEQKKCEHIDKNYIFGSGDIVNGLDMAMEIIRKHMNDGWIPVETFYLLRGRYNVV